MEKKNQQLLVVDDNEEFLTALKIILSPHFRRIVTETVPDRILPILQKEKFDIILLDMNFKAGIQSGNEGFFWLNKIRELDEDITVIFITAYGDVEVAIRAMKEGVADFIQKSWDEKKILSAILSASRWSETSKEIRGLRDQQKYLLGEKKSEDQMIWGPSSKMKELRKLIDKIAPTDANILITGESGSGKELIAREIHARSRRSGEILMRVDLGSLHENLFESELFGHCKGAFTDAYTHKPGKIELSSGGTLFLDEIGNLPLPLQSKLLSVLQNRSVTRLGENSIRSVDFRLISATNLNLAAMIKQIRFREDLHYRINTVQINLPPLREHPEDIQELSYSFLSYYSAKYKKGIDMINPESLIKLKEHLWPGNIRELRHVIEKAVIFCDSEIIMPADIQITSAPEDKKTLNFNLETNEKEVIRKALESFNWNMSITARELGINRSTLYDKIKKYEIQ